MQNNRIFVPKESQPQDIMVRCDHAANDNEIAEWIQNYYGVKVISVKIDKKSKNFAVVIIDGDEVCSKQELLTFSSAYKRLPDNAIGQDVKKYIK